jgi:hypothetical protein
MMDVVVFKTANHLNDSIDFAYVIEKFISEALSLRRSLDKPGNIEELNHRMNNPNRLGHFSQKVQPIVRDGYYPHVGVDGAEWIVGGFRFPCFGNGIEQG